MQQFLMANVITRDKKARPQDVPQCIDKCLMTYLGRLTIKLIFIIQRSVIVTALTTNMVRSNGI